MEKPEKQEKRNKNGCQVNAEALKDEMDQFSTTCSYMVLEEQQDLNKNDNRDIFGTLTEEHANLNGAIYNELRKKKQTFNENGANNDNGALIDEINQLSTTSSHVITEKQQNLDNDSSQIDYKGLIKENDNSTNMICNTLGKKMKTVNENGDQEDRGTVIKQMNPLDTITNYAVMKIQQNKDGSQVDCEETDNAIKTICNQVETFNKNSNKNGHELVVEELDNSDDCKILNAKTDNLIEEDENRVECEETDNITGMICNQVEEKEQTINENDDKNDRGLMVDCEVLIEENDNINDIVHSQLNVNQNGGEVDYKELSDIENDTSSCSIIKKKINVNQDCEIIEIFSESENSQPLTSTSNDSEFLTGSNNKSNVSILNPNNANVTNNRSNKYPTVLESDESDLESTDSVIDEKELIDELKELNTQEEEPLENFNSFENIIKKKVKNWRNFRYKKIKKLCDDSSTFMHCVEISKRRLKADLINEMRLFRQHRSPSMSSSTNSIESQCSEATSKLALFEFNHYFDRDWIWVDAYNENGELIKLNDIKDSLTKHQSFSQESQNVSPQPKLQDHITLTNTTDGNETEGNFNNSEGLSQQITSLRTGVEVEPAPSTSKMADYVPTTQLKTKSVSSLKTFGQMEPTPSTSKMADYIPTSQLKIKSFSSLKTFGQMEPVPSASKMADYIPTTQLKTKRDNSLKTFGQMEPIPSTSKMADYIPTTQLKTKRDNSLKTFEEVKPIPSTSKMADYVPTTQLKTKRCSSLKTFEQMEPIPSTSKMADYVPTTQLKTKRDNSLKTFEEVEPIPSTSKMADYVPLTQLKTKSFSSLKTFGKVEPIPSTSKMADYIPTTRLKTKRCSSLKTFGQMEPIPSTSKMTDYVLLPRLKTKRDNSLKTFGKVEPIPSTSKMADYVPTIPLKTKRDSSLKTFEEVEPIPSTSKMTDYAPLTRLKRKRTTSLNNIEVKPIPSTSKMADYVPTTRLTRKRLTFDNTVVDVESIPSLTSGREDARNTIRKIADTGNSQKNEIRHLFTPKDTTVSNEVKPIPSTSKMDNSEPTTLLKLIGKQKTVSNASNSNTDNKKSQLRPSDNSQRRVFNREKLFRRSRIENEVKRILLPFKTRINKQQHQEILNNIISMMHLYHSEEINPTTITDFVTSYIESIEKSQ